MKSSFATATQGLPPEATPELRPASSGACKNSGSRSRVATKVSVIIACRNERAFITDCLDSILANDYPQELTEVLVVDGMSDDNTRQIVERYCERFPFVRLLENPLKIASAAFNLGIQCASGDLIVIMGAHNVYPPDYISRCVRASNESGADNVGGIIRVLPRTSGLLGRALVLTLSHPFGVGNAHFRCRTAEGMSERRSVDTVFGGCYRREAFQKAGLFNEKLVFNQDIEFNLRLRRAGGRIILDPEIVSEYRARSDVKSFRKHNFRNGSWVVLAALFSDGASFSWRHLVPLAFVVSLLVSIVMSLVVHPFFWVAAGILASYLLAGLYVSASIAKRERQLRYFAAMPVAFAALHIPYGLGSLAALAKIIFLGDYRRQAILRLAGRRPSPREGV